jgi:hypothetical protein
MAAEGMRLEQESMRNKHVRAEAVGPLLLGCPEITSSRARLQQCSFRKSESSKAQYSANCTNLFNSFSAVLLSNSASSSHNTSVGPRARRYGALFLQESAKAVRMYSIGDLRLLHCCCRDCNCRYTASIVLAARNETACRQCDISIFLSVNSVPAGTAWYITCTSHDVNMQGSLVAFRSHAQVKLQHLLLYLLGM